MPNNAIAMMETNEDENETSAGKPNLSRDNGNKSAVGKASQPPKSRTSPTTKPTKIYNRTQRVAEFISSTGLITASTTAASLNAADPHNRHDGDHTNDEELGIYVTALKPLTGGISIMDCKALSIALDPAYRKTYCGFCCSSDPIIVDPGLLSKKSMRYASNLELCNDCHLISFCSSCASSSSIRNKHKMECPALQRLAAVWAGHSGGDDNGDNNGDFQEQGADVDSCHLLAMRICVLLSKPRLSGQGSQNDDAADAADDLKEQFALMEFLYQCERLNDEAMHFCEGLFNSNGGFGHMDKGALKNQSTAYLKGDYVRVLRQVIGCSHAITDISLPLGRQCLGRALFASQSFYNHSCRPNAYLSCHISRPNDSQADCSNTQNRVGASGCKMFARVNTLRDVDVGDAITLSYIPLCGMARSERQERLQRSYNFVCECELCSAPSGDILFPASSTPEDDFAVDPDPIRQIQYTCNERLLSFNVHQKKGWDSQRCPRHAQQHNSQGREGNHQTAAGELETEQNTVFSDEVNHVLSLIKMTMRGIQNQQIPLSHEVSLECHRLLAMGSSMLHDFEQAIAHHEAFFRTIEHHFCGPLMFDPVALAIQHMEYSRDLLLDCEQKRRFNLDGKHLGPEPLDDQTRKAIAGNKSLAYHYLSASVGSDHQLVHSLGLDKAAIDLRRNTNFLVDSASKKRKLL